MSDISFFGGSGYICSSIRNADFEQKFSLKFSGESQIIVFNMTAYLRYAKAK